MSRVLVPAFLLLVVVGIAIGLFMFLQEPEPEAPLAVGTGTGAQDGTSPVAEVNPQEEDPADTPEAIRAEEQTPEPEVGEDTGHGPTGEYVISGRVVRLEDQQPIAGARIRASSSAPAFAPLDIKSEVQAEFGQTVPAAEQSLQRLDWTDPGQLSDAAERRRPFARPTVVTDAQGHFTIEGLPGPDVHLGVTVARRALVGPTRFSVEAGLRRDGLVLEMARAATVSGVVRDADGRPVEDADVNLIQPFNPYDFVTEGFQMNKGDETETDAEGRFRFEAVPAPGQYQLLVDHANLEPVSLDAFPLSSGQDFATNVVLTQGAGLTVEVVNEDGAPVESARLRLSPAEVDLSDLMANAQRFKQSARSGEDGIATIEGLASGDVVVEVTHRDYLPAEKQTLSLTRGEVIRTKVELVVGGTLTGQVTDEEGNPLEGASIRAAPPRSFANLMSASVVSPRRDRTDEDGRFEIKGLPTGNLEVVAEAKDYQRVEQDAEAGGADLNIVMRALSAIEGIVVSRVTGAPVKEFQIEAEQKQGGFGFDFEQMGKDMLMQRALPIRTDNGRFRLTGVEPGEYRLTIEAPGHALALSEWIEVKEHEVKKGLLFYLGPEAALAGTIIDAATRDPVPGARVALSEGSNPIEQVMSKMFGDQGESTGEDGVWHIGGLSTGKYQVLVTHPQYAAHTTAQLEAREGDTTAGIVIELDRGAEVYGVIYGPDGQPAPEATIFINDATSTNLKSAKSAGDGSYRIQALPAGQYVMTKLPSTFRMDNTEEMMEQFSGGMETHNVTLAAGDSVRQDFGLQERGDGSLEGQVLQGGSGVDGAFVTVIRGGENYNWQGSGGMHTAITKNGGQFHIEGLTPGPAIVQLQVMHKSFAMPASLRMHEVNILESGVTTLTIELPGGSLTGVAVDAATREPLRGIPVYAARQKDDFPASALMSYSANRSSFAYTEEDGSFQLRSLDPGRYQVVVGSRDLLGMTEMEYGIRRVDDVMVPDSGTADIGFVELEPAAVLTGDVESSSGGMVAGATVFLRRPDSDDLLEKFSLTTTDGGGHFEMPGAPSGDWDVLFRAPGHAVAETRVRLRAGQTTHVNITMAGGTDVYLVLKDLIENNPGQVDLNVVGPNGRIVSGLFGLSDLTGSMFSQLTPGEYYVGCFDAGNYRATGRVGNKTFDQEFVLAGEPELRIPIRLPD